MIGSADVVAGVVQIGLGQGHEEAVHPVDALGPQLAVPRHFRPEEHLHVFFFQAERIGEGGHDDRLQQAFDQLVAAQGDAVLVQDLAADVVVDLRLEVVPGDHQVGRAAADVDAGDADFIGLVAERLRLGLLALAPEPPGRGAPGRATARRAVAGRRGRHFRHVFHLGLLAAAVLVHGGEPQPRVLAQHPQFAPDVGQVAGAGLVDAQVDFRLAALVLAQRGGEDVDGLHGLGGQAALLLLDHAAGIAHGHRADFAGPAGLAGGIAIGDRVDVGVGLGQHLVERGRHQHAGRVPRLRAGPRRRTRSPWARCPAGGSRCRPRGCT